MRSFFDDEHATRELVLFAVNTGALYPERARLEKEAKKQIENGTYAVGVWQQIWRGWFDKAANRYVKELPKSGDPASLFPDRVRNDAAVEWEEYERGFVGQGFGAGGEVFGGAKPNPTARKGYSKRAALDRDLERYYSNCMPSASKRFKEKRAKSYCSAVSWKVARQSGRYPDYFHENPLTIGEGDKIAIGVGLAAGVAAVFYYLTRPSTTA